jgi:hypothetical protein
MSLDESWGFRLEEAVDRFNESGSARTVAGLMRTLGVPRVSVGAAAGSGDEVRITVAWELTWYQWGVDTGDLSRPVFELGRGGELAELDGSARVWNGSAAESGCLSLGLGSVPPAPLSRAERLRRALT